MFKKSIAGLDKILIDDIPHGGIIIVTGTAGSLKSAFVYNLLSKYLKNNTDEKGLYVTLEESKASHVKNMRSLGIKLEKRLKISDLASFRAHINFEEMDYLDLIKRRALGTLPTKKTSKTQSTDTSSKRLLTKESVSLSGKKKSGKGPFSCFALDSLNALYSLINVDRNQLRNKLMEFFTFLRDNEFTSFIVLEMPQDQYYSDEFFLADGIVEFGITTASQNKLKRYIQVKKMRATKHNLEPYLVEVGKSGLEVVGKLA
jgi:KaiC/GvpD/RAD55 family RecA-like ATPase